MKILPLLLSLFSLTASAGVPYVLNYGTQNSNWIGGTVTLTNFQARINNTGVGNADVFQVVDGSGDVLLRFFPIGASKSNYFTLFIGAFGVTNTVNADLSDIFMRQSNVGYHAVEFGDETNSWWLVGGGGTSLTGWIGDLGGLGNQYQLFDQNGTQFYQGVDMSQVFATLANTVTKTNTQPQTLAGPLVVAGVLTNLVGVRTATTNVQLVISPKGITNSFNVNAVALLNCTNVSYTIINQDRVSWYTSSVMNACIAVPLSPGSAVTNASGLSGRLVPF